MFISRISAKCHFQIVILIDNEILQSQCLGNLIPDNIVERL